MTPSWIHSIPGWLTPHEGEFLSKAVRSVEHVDGDVVEIGSFEGKSTIFLASATSHVTAVDPHMGTVSGGSMDPTYKKFLSNLKRADVLSKVTPMVVTSKVASQGWTSQIKFLFIDGLHDEAHAKEDVNLWSPFVEDGGIIAMHDAFCGWDGAGRVATREIIYNPEYGEIGVVGSIIYGVKGRGTRGRILKLFRKGVMELCQNIYENKILPKWIQYILVHKLLRVLLLNRFSSF